MASKTLADLLKERLGVDTYERVSAPGFQVGTSIISVARQNPNRVALLFVNLSANTVYLSPDGVPSSTHGIALGANGGFLALNYRDDMSLCGMEWAGIASGAGSDIFVLELLTLAEKENKI